MAAVPHRPRDTYMLLKNRAVGWMPVRAAAGYPSTQEEVDYVLD